MTTTVYIVPAVTDQGGQCRIVSRPSKVRNARDDYRHNPSVWGEIGLMNSRGMLVCIVGDVSIMDELKSCEPLMAGMEFEIDEDLVPA